MCLYDYDFAMFFREVPVALHNTRLKTIENKRETETEIRTLDNGQSSRSSVVQEKTMS